MMRVSQDMLVPRRSPNRVLRGLRDYHSSLFLMPTRMMISQREDLLRVLSNSSRYSLRLVFKKAEYCSDAHIWVLQSKGTAFFWGTTKSVVHNSIIPQSRDPSLSHTARLGRRPLLKQSFTSTACTSEVFRPCGRPKPKLCCH
jgi:hypothetical protein